MNNNNNEKDKKVNIISFLTFLILPKLNIKKIIPSVKIKKLNICPCLTNKEDAKEIRAKLTIPIIPNIPKLKFFIFRYLQVTNPYPINEKEIK